MTDVDLVRELKDAGFPEQAAQLERERLARELKDQGREDLADQLQGDQAPAANEEQPTATDQEQSEGERFLEELRAASQAGWTSVPGLLDR
jgi:hypothetical protein